MVFIGCQSFVHRQKECEFNTREVRVVERSEGKERRVEEIEAGKRSERKNWGKMRGTKSCQGWWCSLQRTRRAKRGRCASSFLFLVIDEKTKIRWVYHSVSFSLSLPVFSSYQHLLILHSISPKVYQVYNNHNDQDGCEKMTEARKKWERGTSELTWHPNTRQTFFMPSRFWLKMYWKLHFFSW